MRSDRVRIPPRPIPHPVSVLLALLLLTVSGCNPRLFFLDREELVRAHNRCVLRYQGDPEQIQQQCRSYLQELRRRGEIGEAPAKVINVR